MSAVAVRGIRLVASKHRQVVRGLLLESDPRCRRCVVRFIMAAPNINELLALDVQARLALVQELWDSIIKDAQSGGELPVSQAERAELDDRLREDDEDPGAAISWPQARERLRKGS